MTSIVDLSKPSLNPCLREFWMTKARNKVLYGGRASSKSWDAAGFATYLADNLKLRVLCTRQFQNRIDESVYSLLKIQIDRFGLNHRFKITDKSIINKFTNTEFLFYGLARNINEVKSTESVDILWIEEANSLNEEQWKVLEPTIRKEGSQIWLVFNPGLITDFVYQRFVVNPPPDTIVRKINYNENPFLSQTMKNIIEAAKEEDYDNYMHIYEGEPLNDDEMSVIKRSWIIAACDAHIKLGINPSGAHRLGFDVADAGEDACALVASHGSFTYWSDTWKGKEDELLKSCTRVWHKARETSSKIVYDAIGVGATAGAKFNELNALNQHQLSHEKFFAGGSVIKPDAFYDADAKIRNKDFFSNVKAQAWWLVADRLRNTYNAVINGQKFNEDEMLFIDANMPNLTALIDELSTPKKDYDLAGRVKVESKKDLAKRDVSSPNLADAFIMANLPSEFKKRSFFG